MYRIRYTIDHRQGLAALLGDVGLGKSTILRYLWAEYAARADATVLFSQTSQFPSPFALARHVASSFGVAWERSLVAQRGAIERFLIAEYKDGRNVVLFLDEAQLLTADCLELVRTMLNFETGTEKLIQVIMAGQLDLRDRLKTAKYKALKSRIFAPCVLNVMTPDEIIGMFKARCQWACIEWPFAEDAIREIYDYSCGVPRTALRIAEMAYGLAQTLGCPVDAELIKQVTASDETSTAAATAA